MLEREFAPFDKEDLNSLEKFQFCIKLMINGQTSQAFSGMSLPPLEIAGGCADDIISLSRLEFGSPRLLAAQRLSRQLGY
jgi:hypothetical protein